MIGHSRHAITPAVDAEPFIERIKQAYRTLGENFAQHLFELGKAIQEARTSPLNWSFDTIAKRTKVDRNTLSMANRFFSKHKELGKAPEQLETKADVKKDLGIEQSKVFNSHPTGDKQIARAKAFILDSLDTFVSYLRTSIERSGEPPQYPLSRKQSKILTESLRTWRNTQDPHQQNIIHSLMEAQHKKEESGSNPGYEAS